MCQQCRFCYCGPCFDALHPQRGPLAEHTITVPIKKRDVDNDSDYCVIHEEEKFTLFCLQCRSVICYICKEFGTHKNHEIQVIEDSSREMKVNDCSLILLDLNFTIVYSAQRRLELTPKALGFLLPVQHWGGGGEVFSTPSVKLDPDILES